MPAEFFRHVRAWVFDLDNTLYDPAIDLFAQIEALMNDYIVGRLGVSPDAATAMRRQYWAEHGTTLAGLMAHHQVDADDFLDAVHRIDLSALAPDPALSRAIAALPGRRIVYTNGSRAHAHAVLAARGLSGQFDAVYGLEDAGYHPKPREEAFARVFGLDGLQAAQAAMFEDDARNLAVPHRLGMRTVLVSPEPQEADHIHHHTPDLPGFLSQVV
jgi:putative hydrolase of the HAD superfamily